MLTQQHAGERAARVDDVRYELRLDIEHGASSYRGEVTVQFRATGSGDTFLDFRGRQVERLEINGTELTPTWADCRLILPGAHLTPETRVRVVYQNDFDHTGDGFHRFVDPEDGETYLFTDFEPYSAHRLFPCFDQPDLKATYRLTVTAPAGWEVVSNAPVDRTEPAADGRTTHCFQETLRFSTYLFALVVGPYHAVRDEYRGIPLGLFCRRSLARHLDPDEVFTITRQGLDFYPDFFDYPYPFKKYDQLFVPEYNAGAMENVGAVTFSERMIFRDPPTAHQRLSRAEVILHEMAHMWFGDLVTMRWWNDLWLNESFATYMSYLALEHATRFGPDAWTSFNGIKGWAYRQDQLCTTHPVAGEVPDTDHTFLNFDGITYGKGAAAMRQLVAAIGLDAFREGMRRYFRRHEFGNASLRDFLDAIAVPVGGRALTDWAHLWLEKPALNTLRADVTIEGERITRLRLQQEAPPEHPTLRPHRVDVVLGWDKGGTLTLEALPAFIDGAEVDVPAAVGRPAPALVFPNHQDLTFAQVALDARTLAYVRANLEGVHDPLLRQLLGASLWSMVRDRQLSSLEYLALQREKLPLEPDLELTETTLGHATLCLSRYVPEEERAAAASALCEVALRGIGTAPPGDARLTWARALVNAAFSPEDLRLAADLCDGARGIGEVPVDQDMRWTVATKWIARGMPGAEERLAEERRRDVSDRGQRAALRAEVARPDAGAKAAAWERFHGEGFGSLHLTTAAMSGFAWSFQREILLPFSEAFFEQVVGVFASRPPELARAYVNHLFPAWRVEPAVLERSAALLASLNGEHPILARMLREANDDLARSIACRAHALQVLSSSSPSGAVTT
ncbi:aminopeptidase N [Chondromyces apiculatus]|uniref:Aminopeptidase N n=1 Tax=Chondromyces apiculatus DSM 436 TaxID=1192034 RepID=A0A017T6U1_9BACT|nr:aminopeptidase N [Chondromyces apiculatus]EYF04301.1 Membrane alanine aminopeptidase N [Chondromyces apiculatus DSM 436]